MMGAGIHSQEELAKCPISGVPLFSGALDLRVVILVSSPLPAPLSYLYVGETRNFREKFGL